MDFIRPGTYIDFMKHRGLVAMISGALCVASLVSLFVPGPRFGIDFDGGTELQLRFEGDIEVTELRTVLSELDYERPDVIAVSGHPNEFIVRVHNVSTIAPAAIEAAQTELGERIDGNPVKDVRVSPGGDKITLVMTREAPIQQITEGFEAANIHVRAVTAMSTSEDDARYEVILIGVGDELVRKLDERLGERGPESPLRIEWVGPKAGEQLRDAAIQSLLYTLIFIMIYVAFRFDLRFAPGAVVALMHNVLITLGVYVLVRKEMNLTTIAAILTIVGYSINDTIVIYDRIRENLARMRGTPLAEVINVSTSQTLTRTIVTGGTTLASLIVFYFWGTPAIADIAFALFIGIVIGTYSSVYVAAPVTEWMDRKFFSQLGKGRAKRRPAGKPASAGA